MEFGILVAVGYLAGSMPFGYWVVRLTKGVDIRTVGSGNIGATNVWRTYGAPYGVTVMLVDTLKGFVPAFLGVQLVSPLCGIIAGAAAMAGHYRPLFLRFQKGGKMVATAGGVTLALAPLALLCCAALWIAVFLVTRYASVASLVTAVALPVCIALLGYSWPVIVFGIAGAAAVIFMHRQNIRRLVAGTEHRFELRRPRRA